MGLILQGDQSHVTTPLIRTISAIAGNGVGAMRVTTSSPHFFGQADYVNIQATGSIVGSPVNGAAYFVDVIDATHFDLVGSTYTSGTATGTATDLSLTPAFLAPTDGDSFSLQLSGMLSSLQCLADRTQYLRYQQVNPPVTIITGVPGTHVSAVAPGVPTFFTLPFQAITNDLATLKGGTYTDTATRTIGDGGSDTFASGAIVAFASGSRRIWSPRVTLADVNSTVDVTQGETFVLPNTPATTRLITLSTTVGPPQLGERLRFIVPGLKYNGVGAQSYAFTRTGTPAGLLATAWASVSTIAAVSISVEFEFGAGQVLFVTGTASGAGGAVKLTLALPTHYGLGNPTDSLATGDQVVVASVGGTTEADGTWTITVNDGTHITLTGSTFVHAWTSGGTAQITPGVWRLGMNSGNSYDGSAQIGVLPDSAS